LCAILADTHSFISIPLFRFIRSSKKSLYKFCFCHPTWVVQPHDHPLVLNPSNTEWSQKRKSQYKIVYTHRPA
jgi:hypothetical protein